MQFKGLRPDQRQASEAAWREWCRANQLNPQLQEFAEFWVDLMEDLAHRQHIQVRHMAGVTLRAARQTVRGLSEAEIRQVVYTLCEVWYLGVSLQYWAERQDDLLRPHS